MPERSREEWIAITLSVVFALAIFMVSFLIFGQQRAVDVSEVGEVGIVEGEGGVVSEVPAPGYEDTVEEMIVEEEGVFLE